jgi:predicted enzyme related to lactoylglutathione lyase
MPAPVVHFEIGFKDIEKAKKFYGPLLGWEFNAYGPAAMISNIGQGGGPGMGIGGHLNCLGEPPHNYCVVYALVEDLAASIKQAEKLGGSCMIPPTEVPGMGHFAWLKDPEGNLLGLWKAAAP